MSENNLAKSLQESAEAAFEELNKEETTEDAEVEEELEETEEEVEEEETEDEPEESEEEPEEEPEETEEVEALGNEDDSQGAEDPRLKNAPTTWTAKAKSKWGELDPEIKAEIRKREDDAMRGLTNYKEKAEFGERMDKTLSPYLAFLKSKNLKPEQAIEDSLNLAYSLTTASPKERGVILMNLAEMYQADMNVQASEKVDPQVQSLMNEVRH